MNKILDADSQRGMRFAAEGRFEQEGRGRAESTVGPPRSGRLPPKAITRFTGEYKFLSNFYSVRVRLGDEYYPSVEHGYQASKTEDPGERARIRECQRAGEAKRMGRTKVTLRKDWEHLKEAMMLHLLREKFSRGDIRALLLATGGMKLVEGNNWHDEYWGECDGNCRYGPHPPRGRNRLGELLMQVREEIRNGAL